MIELNGRVALVTGGSRGIGWACVEMLVRAGAECAFTYVHSVEAAAEAVQLVRDQGGICEAVRLDLSDPESIGRAVDEVIDRLGRIDVLVNNAAIWNVEPVPAEVVDVAAIDRLLAINLRGTMLVTSAVARDMLRRDWGRIISIGSTAGIRGEAGHAVYAATKGALLAWSRSLIPELSPRGITANVVSPGWVSTDMTRDVLTPDSIAELEAVIPTRRLTRPDHVAVAVSFLASPLAEQITGVNLDVNGGAVLS